MGYFEKYILRPIEREITDEDAKVELICSKDHPVMNFFYESCFYRHDYVLTEETYALPYEELFCFASTVPGENKELGATVSITVNGQVFTSDKNFMIAIPAFVPHGQIRITDMKTPIFSYVAGAGREHVSMPEENWVTEDVKPIEDMVIYYNGDMYDPHESAKGHMTVLMQAYYKYIPGTQFFSILRRFEANGPWFFAGGHLHNNPELLAYYGADPWHPYEMKQKIVQYIGGEKYILEYPCVCYFPPYVFHCPLDIKETEKPAFWHSLAPTMSEYSKSKVLGLSGENGDAEVKKPW